MGGADDRAPEDFADALVSEADPEQRDLTRQLANGRHGDAAVLRPSRSRRNQDSVGLLGSDPRHVDGVIAEDDRHRSELAELLDQVVDEGVVVIDDQDPRAHLTMVTEPPGVTARG
jgi:hypothetical protein